jgi:putative SOS response-associated peptidase YedK
MCGRYNQRTNPAEFGKLFQLDLHTSLVLNPRYNIAPTQDIPVISQRGASTEVALMRWGLIPSWSTDPQSGPPLFNARSETVVEKPSFRTAMKRRRCLIPADGFFEWKKLGPKTKQPYHIHPADERPFAFAGLWEQWQDLESCTILTTAPKELMAPIHDRMPGVVDPIDYEKWLDPAIVSGN